MTSRPDEISTSTAAALVGVSYEMVRRLVRSGHIISHARGLTTVSAAVQGYAAFLREEAARAEANAAAVRSHRAKAATMAAANERRRAGLIDRAEAEQVVTAIAAIAATRLRGFAMTGQLAPATARQLAAEVKAVAGAIEADRERVLAQLRGEVTDAE